MSQWDKLVANILAENKNLRFEELAKALIKIGYTMEQPRGGQQPLYVPQGWMVPDHHSETESNEQSIY